MKKMISLLVLWLWISPAVGHHLSQDKLLREIEQAQTTQNKIDPDKEAQFLSDKANQQHLLDAVQAEIAKEQANNAKLKQQLEINAAQLRQLQTKLAEQSGSLLELFTVARQVAGDLKAELDNSLISAQFPDRAAKLAAISEGKTLPTLAELEQLWFTLQQEMTESGKVVYYNGEVLSAAGEPRQTKIVRIGAFNAVADGRYLRYLPETGKLSDLPRQPKDQFLQMAEKLAKAQSGQVKIAIDPTRGAILGMLIQTPDLKERIQQGGIIGYITMTLGVLCFFYGLFRLFQLADIGKKMQSQLTNPNANEDNPLGRIFALIEKGDAEDTNNLELLLDEAITREVPVLEKGLAIIKLVAAIGPLLGLLGTVTGMIVTFQSISLYGSGDPKLMAEGISQALVTTVQGLCVAIPLLFLHSLVASRSRVLIQILDEQTAGLISRRAGK